jgi:hypothetical protein
MFLAYKALVKKKIGHQLQILKMYNGSGHVNKFTTYCTRHEIQMEHTIPYTPQQKWC